MAISYIGGSASTAILFQTQTHTLPSHQAGDLLLTQCIGKCNAPAIPAPTGWRKLPVLETSASSDLDGHVRMTLLLRAAPAGGATNPSIVSGTGFYTMVRTTVWRADGKRGRIYVSDRAGNGGISQTDIGALAADARTVKNGMVVYVFAGNANRSISSGPSDSDLNTTTTAYAIHDTNPSGPSYNKALVYGTAKAAGVIGDALTMVLSGTSNSLIATLVIQDTPYPLPGINRSPRLGV